jgi:thiamine-phosphate pyrophosphorylase
MFKTLAKARLARVAMALNERARCGLPTLVLMTDDERLLTPLIAARNLPRGSMVIVRARRSSHRAKLAHSLRPVARARGLILLVANDPSLADRIGAQGLHLSEANAREACTWRARRPRWLITSTAHTLAACASAKRLGADAAFLSPVFTTASHPGVRCLGAARARVIAHQATIPIYALGGMNAQTAMRLACAPFVGIAAIGALAA